MGSTIKCFEWIDMNRLPLLLFYLLLTASLIVIWFPEATAAVEVLTYDIGDQIGPCSFALPPDASVLGVKLEFYRDSGAHPKGSVIEPRFTQFWFRAYKVLVAWADDPPNPTPQMVGCGAFFFSTMQITFDKVAGPISSAPNPDPLADATGPRLIRGFQEAWRAYRSYEVKYVSQAPSFPSNIYKYLVITDEGWLSILEPFIQLKARLGMPVLAVSRQWIETTYAGDSVQQKTWYFLRDAYNRWQPSYLLIAGDTDTVPTWTMRKLTGISTDLESTSDWHYSFLDGDSSGYDDWLPEIVVSRLPATDRSMLVDMLSKIVDYHNMQYGDWTRRVLVIAGEEYWTRKTYMIETMNNFVKDYIPTEMSVTRLYAGYNLTADNVVSEINKGVAVAIVDAHGDASGFDPFYTSEASRLTNGRMLPLFQVFACGVAPYDSGSSDYWALTMLKNPAGGAISIMGARAPIFVGTMNLEDGPHLAPYYYLPLLFGKSLPKWFAPYYTYLFEGIRFRPFRQGDSYFFDQIIQGGVGWFGSTPALNFFGDPDISLLGFEPRTLSIDASAYWSPDGRVTIRVFNSNTGVPIPGIVTRVMSSGSFYFESSTDSEGAIEFKLPEILRQPGGVAITVYALNYNAATTGTFTISGPPSFSFEISPPQPQSQTVQQGQSATFTVAVTTTSESPQEVTLDIPNVPPGAYVSWNPSNVMVPNPSGAVTSFTVQTSSSTPAQTYADIYVSGSGGGRSASSPPFTLTVTTSLNQAPIALIDYISPDSVTLGQPVSFSGHGTDPEGDPIVDRAWTSSLQGELSRQDSFSRSDLTLGVHQICYKVKDNREAWSNEDCRSLTVNPQVTETPPRRCIIATAAYSSEMAPYVVYMRYVRDELIGSTPTGITLVRSFDAFYYSWSPLLAEAIAGNGLFRGVFRILLLPLVTIVHATALTFTAVANLTGNADIASAVAFLAAALMAVGTYVVLPLLAVARLGRAIRRRQSHKYLKH
jgi:VCBS repeat-containing protein